MSRKEKSKKPKVKGRGLRIVGIVVAALLLGSFIWALVGNVGVGANLNMIRSMKKVADEDALVPEIDPETGCWTFTCDRTFRVLQLTDIHVGGGALSIKKDNLAFNAVYDMIKETKPDLIVVTGDLVFPVPFMSGSFNNLTPTKMVIELLERTGIYWTFGFGNHDTEVYSYYSREEIAEMYEESKFEHCLFMRGPEKTDGEGNHIINVQNSQGIITQSLFIFDSHSYSQGFWRDYDNIHENQVTWYEEEITRLDAINRDRGATEMLKSMMFFHIPLVEYRDAFEAYKENDYKDTDNVKYVYGIAGEPDEVICCGVQQDDLFEKVVELRSTQAIFCGHDHLNNFSLDYNGGEGDYYVRLTYGFSIDYLAYFGIVKKTAQRGGTIIDIAPDSTFDCYGVRLVDKHEIHTVEDFYN